VNERDPGPLARFEVVKSSDETAGVVFQRVCEGETLKEIARAWGVPNGAFTQWYTGEHGEKYEAALRVRADDLAHEALGISDEQVEVKREDGSAFDPAVPRDKLRVETRLKLAGKWDRERYGDRTDVKHSGLLPTLTIEIVGVPQAQPTERVVAEQPRTPYPPAQLSDAELI
jgi:hypothetical protein